MTALWRSLTVQQPWAWAIMLGGKTVENRTWGTDLGTVAIHAGLNYDRFAEEDSYPLREAWARVHSDSPTPMRRGARDLPTGVILGTVDIVDVHLCSEGRGCYRQADVVGWVPIDGSDASEEGWAPRVCSQWGDVPAVPPKRGWGWARHFVLANHRPLEHPVEFTGHLGMRRLPADVEATVRARLESQRR